MREEEKRNGEHQEQQEGKTELTTTRTRPSRKHIPKDKTITKQDQQR
jgi:hypothetical protein